jgi:hypothetical protein
MMEAWYPKPARGVQTEKRPETGEVSFPACRAINERNVHENYGAHPDDKGPMSYANKSG